jgi:hypothetical protein
MFLSGRSRCFVAKYDAAGVVAWTKVAPYQDCWARGLAFDGAGGLYVAASHRHDHNSIDRDWGILKYDAEGRLLWARTWGDSPESSDDIPYRLAATASGVVVSGVTNGPMGATLVTRYYNPDGSLVWEGRRAGNSSPEFLARDSSGRVTVAGAGFVIRYDPLGNVAWTQTPPSSSPTPTGVDEGGSVWQAWSDSQRTWAVKWRQDGLEAWRNSWAAASPVPVALAAHDGVVVVVSGGGTEPYSLTRLDAAGSISWQVQGPALTADTVDLGASGRVTVGGSTSDGSAFSVAVHESSGALAWQHTHDATPVLDRATALAVAADGSIHLSGASVRPGPAVIGMPTVTYAANGSLLWTAAQPPSPGIDEFGEVLVSGDGSVTVPAYRIHDGTSELRQYSSSGQLSWARTVPWLDYWAPDLAGGAVGAGATGVYGAEDALIERYDRNGSRIWSHVHAGLPATRDTPTGVAVGPDGSIVVATYDPASSASLAKYDRYGNLAWTRHHPNSVVTRLAFDDLGSVYAAGSTSPSPSDFLVLKYSGQGDLAWKRVWPGPNATHELAVSMAVNPVGQVTLTGFAFAGVGNESCDYITVKLDARGNPMWARTMDGAGKSDFASSVALDGDDNVFVTGLSGEGGGYGVRTVSYDALGNERWLRFHAASLLGNPAQGLRPAMSVAADGSMTVATRTWTGSDFDLAVLRYDNSGSLVWVKTLAGDPSGEDTAFWTAVDAGGGVTVSGRSWSHATGDDGVLLHFKAAAVSRRFHTLTPCRILDTRLNGSQGPVSLQAGTIRVINTTGVCGIPASARVLVLNLTVTGATAPGNLRVFAGGFPAPHTSTANYRPGQTRANNAVVGLGTAGRLGLMADQASGTLDVILDVSGYFE